MRQAANSIAFFNKRSNAAGFARSVFGITNDKPQPMSAPIYCIIALYRLGKAEGPNSPLFSQVIDTWRTYCSEELKQLHSIKSMGHFSARKRKFKNLGKLSPDRAEEWERRFSDPLYNHKVIVRQQNELLRKVAIALNCPEESFFLPVPIDDC